MPREVVVARIPIRKVEGTAPSCAQEGPDKKCSQGSGDY